MEMTPEIIHWKNNVYYSSWNNYSSCEWALWFLTFPRLSITSGMESKLRNATETTGPSSLSVSSAFATGIITKALHSGLFWNIHSFQNTPCFRLYVCRCFSSSLLHWEFFLSLSTWKSWMIHLGYSSLCMVAHSPCVPHFLFYLPSFVIPQLSASAYLSGNITHLPTETLNLKQNNASLSPCFPKLLSKS